MKAGWVERFHTALKNDGRSMRAISTAAGCGPNFIQQLVRDGKEPGADKLARILDVLGQDAALYVLSGVEITEDDIEFIGLMKALSPKSRADALRFFRGLQGDADDQVPLLDSHRSVDSK